MSGYRSGEVEGLHPVSATGSQIGTPVFILETVFGDISSNFSISVYHFKMQDLIQGTDPTFTEQISDSKVLNMQP